MAPPQAAEVGAAPREGECQGQQENGLAASSPGVATPAKGKSALHELWKKNEAKAKRVVKLLRRKRQKQQKRQEQQPAGAAGTKEELLAAVPLRSKQRDLLLPLGRNKKLKKKLEAALEVDPHEAETESEDEGDTASEGEGSDAENAAVKKEAEDPQVEVEFVPAEESEGADGAVAQLAEAFADVFEKLNANVKPVVQVNNHLSPDAICGALLPPSPRPLRECLQAVVDYAGSNKAADVGLPGLRAKAAAESCIPNVMK